MSPSQAVLASIRRYPVKSMMGEELNSVAVTKRAAGDCAYSLIDVETNKLVNTKAGEGRQAPIIGAYPRRDGYHRGGIA
jgi:uncharacterized protein YcbX